MGIFSDNLEDSHLLRFVAKGKWLVFHHWNPKSYLDTSNYRNYDTLIISPPKKNISKQNTQKKQWPYFHTSSLNLLDFLQFWHRENPLQAEVLVYQRWVVEVVKSHLTAVLLVEEVVPLPSDEPRESLPNPKILGMLLGLDKNNIQSVPKEEVPKTFNLGICMNFLVNCLCNCWFHSSPPPKKWTLNLWPGEFVTCLLCPNPSKFQYVNGWCVFFGYGGAN